MRNERSDETKPEEQMEGPCERVSAVALVPGIRTKKRTTGNLDAETIDEYAQVLYTSRQSGSTAWASRFRYLEAAEYLSSVPKFAETGTTEYRPMERIPGKQVRSRISENGEESQRCDEEQSENETAQGGEGDNGGDEKEGQVGQSSNKRERYMCPKGVKGMKKEENEWKRHMQNTELLRGTQAEMKARNTIISEAVAHQKQIADAEQLFMALQYVPKNYERYARMVERLCNDTGSPDRNTLKTGGGADMTRREGGG